MGRTGTWLVGAVVCAIGAAAVVDAVVGGGSPAEPVAATDLGGTRLAEPISSDEEFLRSESVSGRIVFADQGCRVLALDLPSLEQRDPGAPPSCAFSSSPGGVIGTDAGSVSPREPLIARCSENRIEVRALNDLDFERGPELGRVVERLPGCSPAWTLEGRLLAVRSGEAFDLGLPDQGGRDRVVLSLADVARGFARPPWNFVEPRIEEVAWMDEELLAAVVRDGGGQGDVLALFRGRRLVATTPSPYERLGDLRVSPRGSYVAARIGDAPALVLLDDEGEFVPLGLRAHAVTWSPDEVLTAVANDDGIFVFVTAGRANRFARVPIQARDLFWG